MAVGTQLEDNVVEALLNSSRFLNKFVQLANEKVGLVRAFLDQTGLDMRHIEKTKNLVESICTEYNIFDRDTMIETVVDNLDNWLSKDRQQALNHFAELERQRLEKLPDRELRAEYEEVI